MGQAVLTILFLFWWSAAFLYGHELINAAIDFYADCDPETANLQLCMILIVLSGLIALPLLIRDALIHHFTITLRR